MEGNDYYCNYNNASNPRVLPKEQPHAKKKCCGFDFAMSVEFIKARIMN